METRVTSSAKEVIIGENQSTVLIGEQSNPSGNKRLAEDFNDRQQESSINDGDKTP